MSLLRRIQERNADASTPFDDEPAGDQPETVDADLPIRQLWEHRANSPIFTAAMTRDNRFIIAGTEGGDVLFFDIAGRLLWHGRVNGGVRQIALAEDAQQFVVGTILDDGKNAYLWHYNGRRLHTFETEGRTWSVAITPDASLIVVGSHDKHLYAFDNAGEPVFKQSLNAPVYGVAISASADRIFAAADNHRIFAFDRDGNQQWRFEVGQRPWAGIRVSDENQTLLVGSNDGYAYCLDFDGAEKWRFNTGDFVNTLSVTPDGQYYAAAGSANTIYRFNDQGSVLWEYQARRSIYGLAMTPDGRYTLIGANDNTLYLVDHHSNHRIWRHQTNGSVHAAAMTPSGRFFCCGTQSNTLTVFNNTTVINDLQEVDGPDSTILTRHIVQLVRDDYSNAPYIGLVRWFTEFERSLRNNQFDVCRALLDELNDENGSILNDLEQQYTRSLEGAYWLFRGVAYHRNGHYEEARECYEKSRAIQHDLNNQDGEGQVLAAISLLPEIDSAGESDDDSAETVEAAPHLPPALNPETRRLLNEIVQRPRVLGTSEKLLEQRLGTASAQEQFQIVLLAKNSGYIAVLIRALQSPERVVRAAASAALTFLEPGPDTGVLLQMLHAPDPFVRWQALRMLVDHASDAEAEAFKETKSTIWAIVLNPDNGFVDNPLTRRETARLVAAAGDENDTPWLIAQLEDSDPDVLLAVIEALGAVGDRSALPELRAHENHYAFLGQSTRAAAEDAISAIEKRHPLPTIGNVALSDSDPLTNNTVREKTVFMTGEATIYGVVTVEHIKPGTQVAITWRRGETTLHSEIQEINDDLPDNEDIAAIQDTPRSAPPSRPSPLGRSRDRTRAPLPPRPSRYERRGDPPPERRSRPTFGRREPVPAGPTRDSQRRVGPAPTERSRPDARSERAAPPSRRASEERAQPSGWRSRSRYAAPGSDRDAPLPPPRNRESGSTRGSSGRSSRPRFSRTPVPAPNENVDPRNARTGPSSRPGAASRRSDQPEPPSFLRRRPLPDREPSPSRPSSLRDRQPERPSYRSGSRFGRDTDENDRRPTFGRRPPAEDSPFGRSRRSPFGSRDRDPNPFSRTRRPQLPDHARRLVVAFPAPEEQWQPGTYNLEIKIDNSTTRQVQFKVQDEIQILGLDPGLLPSLGQQNFAHTSTFLSSAKYIDCQVHLKDAPYNLPLTGRIYNANSGALIQQTSASTRYEGDQVLNMTWEQPWWRPGPYRIEVTADRANTVHTEIEVISHYSVADIVLCHQIGPDNGAIGTDWPFYPDDTCYCVVELGTPPPGVEFEVTWHQKSGDWKNAPRRSSRGQQRETQRYTTKAESNQRAAFKLTPPENKTLTPGHYSVVISGPSVTRAERSFEVKPYPLSQRARESISSAWGKVEPAVKRHHLRQVLAVTGMMVLLALALLLLNTITTYATGSHRANADPVLDIGQAVSHVNPLWFAVWLPLSVGYGLMFTRYEKNKSSDLEEILFVPLNTLLILFSTLLVGYQFSYLAFGPTYLWPGTFWRLLENIQWANPGIAWLALPIALVFVETARQDDHEWPFYIAPFWTAIGIVIIVLTCYAGALALGLPAGLLGAVIGSILRVAGVSNDLGHLLLHVGGNLGFIFGPMIAALVYWREDVLGFWSNWRTRKANHASSDYSLLYYIAEENTILKPLVESDILIKRARYAALLLVEIVLVVLILFEPVIIPALDALYEVPNDGALPDVLRTAPLKSILGLTLMLAWPALVYWGYRSARTLGLPGELGKAARRFALVIMLAPLAALTTVFVTAQNTPGHTWPVSINLYWINRAGALAAAIFITWAAFAIIRRMPASVRRDYVPELSLGDLDDVALVAAVLAIIIAAILLPVWMWGALLLLILLTLAGGATLARRIS